MKKWGRLVVVRGLISLVKMVLSATETADERIKPPCQISMQWGCRYGVK